MLTLVADQDSRRFLVRKISRRKNLLTFEVRSRDSEIAAGAIGVKNECALDRPDDHQEVAALWGDSIRAFPGELQYYTVSRVAAATTNSTSSLATDHPRDAEAIDQRAESLGPESLLDRKLDRAGG